MRFLVILVTLFASMWPEPQATTKTFNITAHQFAFDISPSPFVVNAGDTVTLNMTSRDVIHGFFMPDWGVNVDLVPGKTVTKTFVANAAGSFTYQCSVSTCGSGHTSMVGTFIVNAAPPAPTVTSFTPANGPAAGGTVVTITGTNFQSGATVMFGDAAAASVTINSATSISATAPAHASGGVTIVVTNPDGQSATAGTFTFAPSGPTVTSFVPTFGPSAGGTVVTITGTNFQSGATVKFGDASAASVTFNSATSITATTSAHAPAIVPLIVTNPDGQSITALSFSFVGPPGHGRRRAVGQHG